MTSDIQKIFAFIIELDKLKSVLRKTKPLGCDRYENSAEHSWQVCMLAVLLANESPKPINVARAVEILLVHDIPEIDAGDRIVYLAKDAKAIQNERSAAERIFGLLPEPHASWCIERWEEYEARQSDEAVFAYAVDRLMPVLHNLGNSGQSWVENRVSLDKILSVNSAIGNALPTVWQYVQSLIAGFAESTTLPSAAADAQPSIPPDSNLAHLSPVLRPATISDLSTVSELAEHLAALHHEAWPSVFAPASGSGRDDAHWQESITGNGRATLVAELDGSIVGFVALAVDTETHSLFQPVRFTRVNSVCVATWAQGKGVGRALMQEAEAWAMAQKASEIRLVVWAFNQAALRMYEELGYTLRAHTLGKVLGSSNA